MENVDAEIFDPEITTKKSLSEGFRAFRKKQETDEPPSPMPTWPTEEEADPETQIYTDGSCKDNGSLGAIAGAGVWYGNDDARNVSARLPKNIENSNNSAEAIAILLAIRNTRSEATLRILTDSKVTMDGLTRLLHKHENEGWLGAANKNIIKTIVDSLRTRKGLTIFEKVKGHSNIEGNEGADKLAKKGSDKDLADEIKQKQPPLRE
ncbi:hypothetical protein H0H92_008017 [Tricholoma furcatifolium]|nr:hypothetical protein H0H92_008017 [Tricholoma furcatifolium]